MATQLAKVSELLALKAITMAAVAEIAILQRQLDGPKQSVWLDEFKGRCMSAIKTADIDSQGPIDDAALCADAEKIAGTFFAMMRLP